MSTGVLVGLDVGGTKIQALSVTADAARSITAGSIEPFRQAIRPTIDDPLPLVDALVELAHEVAGGEPMAAVCAGIPAYIDLAGIARTAPHLGSVVGFDVGAAMAERLGVPIVIENDANCAAWSARRLDAPDADNVVAITLGTGIGGGIVLDGKLLRGAHGFAGEPGHMIVDPDGPACSCGLPGCWEVWASGAGLQRLTGRAAASGEIPALVSFAGGPDRVTGVMVMDELDSSDSAVATETAMLLARYTRWVAIGTVNLINLLDPDCIVFSGGIVEHGDALISGIRSAVASLPTMSSGRSPDLRIASQGRLAGAVGAALLAGEALGVR